MAEGLLSIGIPTFNRCKFLRESLRAALRQPYSNLEVVVSDNASSDDTASLVREINDPRVRYHRNPENIGAIQNFKRCLELATGEYFAWLQDDDVIFPNFVSSCLSPLLLCKELGCSLAFAAHATRIDRHDRMSSRIFGPPGRINWITNECRVVPRGYMVPWALLRHTGFSPVAAFRTDAVRAVIGSAQAVGGIYFERAIIAGISSQHPVVMVPSVCGVWRNHSETASNSLYVENILDGGVASRANYGLLESYLQRAVDASEGLAFDEFLRDLEEEESEALLEYQRRTVGVETAFGRKIAICLDRVLSKRGLVAQIHRVPAKASLIRGIIREISPPIIPRVLRKIYSTFVTKTEK